MDAKKTSKVESLGAWLAAGLGVIGVVVAAACALMAISPSRGTDAAPYEHAGGEKAAPGPAPMPVSYVLPSSPQEVAAAEAEAQRLREPRLGPRPTLLDAQLAKGMIREFQLSQRLAWVSPDCFQLMGTPKLDGGEAGYGQGLSPGRPNCGHRQLAAIARALPQSMSGYQTSDEAALALSVAKEILERSLSQPAQVDAPTPTELAEAKALWEALYLGASKMLDADAAAVKAAGAYCDQRPTFVVQAEKAYVQDDTESCSARRNMMELSDEHPWGPASSILNPDSAAVEEGLERMVERSRAQGLMR